MTKKQNTLVFILLGTIVNVLFSILFILGLTVVGFLWFKEYINVVVPVAFIAGLLLGMFVYQKLAKFIIVKFQLEDKLDPIFTARRLHRK